MTSWQRIGVRKEQIILNFKHFLLLELLYNLFNPFKRQNDPPRPPQLKPLRSPPDIGWKIKLIAYNSLTNTNKFKSHFAGESNNELFRYTISNKTFVREKNPSLDNLNHGSGSEQQKLRAP